MRIAYLNSFESYIVLEKLCVYTYRHIHTHTRIYILEKREILNNPRPSGFILVRGLWHSDSEGEPRGAANAIVFSNVQNKE